MNTHDINGIYHYTVMQQMEVRTNIGNKWDFLHILGMIWIVNKDMQRIYHYGV